MCNINYYFKKHELSLEVFAVLFTKVFFVFLIQSYFSIFLKHILYFTMFSRYSSFSEDCSLNFQREKKNTDDSEMLPYSSNCTCIMP